MMPLECKVPGCGKRTEGTTGLCGSHNKALRKIITTPIKKVGDKLKKDLDAYTEAKRVYLQKNPRCAVYPSQRATDVHHMAGRTGKMLMEQKYWLPVCRTAHVKITNDSKWARDNGYTLTRTTKEPS